jgi:hypothetical protein
MCEASRDSKHCTLKLVPFPEHTFFVTATMLRANLGSATHTEKLLHSVIILVSLVYCNQPRDQATNNLAQNFIEPLKNSSYHIYHLS